eukprot:SAG25_NODE_6637_length_542_cov_1.162528_1_plen_43_part_01
MQLFQGQVPQLQHQHEQEDRHHWVYLPRRRLMVRQPVQEEPGV